MDDLRNLKRRLRTRAPYKSDVQIMVEMLGPEPPVVILGQGDYPTAVQIADRVTADMNAAADAIEALQARVAEARNAALEDAALACDDEADEFDDAVKWGRHPKYIASCKAAAYAIRERAVAIRAMKDAPTDTPPSSGRP